ncbi:PAS fold family [Candidatus Moduliflexus flocculans]|uniref:PAS fold family n=1 Tax=Candidatus Moduliflexus flocculans TaxID=1499966 RepID=A0A0S6VYX5_9BACT|nr:PAS fold family [Candidatus Moduliflexus flocculans]
MLSFFAGTFFCCALIAIQEALLGVPVILRSLPWCFIFGGGLGVLLYRRHLQQLQSSRPFEALEGQVEEQAAELDSIHQQLAMLHEIGHSMTASSHLNDVLHTVTHSAAELLKTDTVILLLRDEHDQKLYLRGAYGLSGAKLRNASQYVNAYVSEHVAQSGQPIIANDLPNDSRFPLPSSLQDSLLACVSVPLRIADRIIGTLDAYSKTRRYAFSTTHIRLLEMLAAQSAIAIENARLYERVAQANTDLERRVEERTEALMLANDQLAVEIEERRRVEISLAKERNLLRTLIDHLPDSIYVKNLQGKFLTANPVTAHVMNVAHSNELLGKTDFDFYPPDVARVFHDEEQQIMQSGEARINQEVPLTYRSEETQGWLLSSKIPFRDNEGKIAGIVGIGHDITEQKRIQEMLQRHNQELELLNQMYEMLHACQSEPETYTVLASICQQFFPGDAGGLLLIDCGHDTLHLAQSWGEFPREISPTARQGFFQVLTHDAITLQNPPLPAHSLYQDIFSFGHPCLCVPIIAHQEKIGVLVVFDPQATAQTMISGIALTEKLTLMARIVAQYALSLANLRLREKLRLESIRDALTGLYNRRYMENVLEQEQHRLKRRPAPLSIVMLDIDHFKRFNDTHGHDAGDVVLKELGRFLKIQIRSDDIACRYGGEEFMLILTNAALDVAHVRAEYILTELRKLNIHYHDHDFSLTASIGVASFPEHGQQLTDIIKAADNALYSAKASGRNQVVIAPR